MRIITISENLNPATIKVYRNEKEYSSGISVEQKNLQNDGIPNQKKVKTLIPITITKSNPTCVVVGNRLWCF